jgi:lysyl-tRNA synthetase class 2
VTVVGASAGWQPVYEAAGMKAVYLGDEAVVDCTSFSLEGRAMRGLRQAYHRVQRAGYTVRFHDPAALSPELTAELRALMGESRRGGVERGFSMTLSRVFDPDDTGLLLAVAYDAEGRAAAFCHFVPAADIAGWSLDLMRRTKDPATPNGLVDFVVLETIRYAKARGQWGLGLNFAVMRGVLAGERGDGVLTDLERRVLLRFSETMQIESLWRFNRKYQPLWRQRFVVLGGIGNAAMQGLAIADAEGVTELPVIGRFVGRRAGQRGRVA